jgi:hypothetical protein
MCCCYENHLTYIGSYQEYHLFFCWDKATDNIDRCNSFACLRSEFTPEFEFEYLKRDSIDQKLTIQSVKQ